MRNLNQPTARPRERFLMCGVVLPAEAHEHDGDLSELRGLLEAAGAEPIGEAVLQKRESADSATMLGRGKVEEIGREVEHLRPDAVAVDNDLSPAHLRNLEKAWGVRVVDRSEVILDIFASRARTKQAKLQVELAQAEYLLPRLKRMWTHLERHEGAVGTRGPGETQLETDKRLLRKRVQDLKRELVEIEARKQREVAARADQFTIGIVGYTNAGKSTLLNRLTGSNELAADMLFATLDTRTRKWKLPDGRTVLLSDTVGFLQRLPHHLVASFHATLEETLHADLLMHVVDASHPEARAQIAAVEKVLTSLSPTLVADLLVLNKVDRVSDPLALELLSADRDCEVVRISAATGEGLDRLTAAVARRVDARSALVEIDVPLADGRSAALVKRASAVLSEEVIDDVLLRIRMRVSESSLGNLMRSVAKTVRFKVLSTPSARTHSESPLAPWMAHDALDDGPAA
ncbi:MAG: GTPase HflX [Planctomycetes bacterium]|nr:GTPase HflX [Planctomycetota bacterium]